MIRIGIFFLLMTRIVLAQAQDTTRLSLLFLGDIMQHDSQINAAYNVKSKSYDYSQCFQFVKPYMQAVDLAIGNLELTLAGPPYKGYPQFSAPDNLAITLKDIGMDVLVTANNHSVDRGRKGIERTIQILDSLQIPHTGTFVDEVNRLNDYPLLLRKNGFLITLLNYTYGTNGIQVPSPTVVNLMDTAQIQKDIVRAREFKPDAIIAFMHWGNEYQNLPNASQKKLTEMMFAQGVDIVIGSHPHVLQPMAWLKDKNKVVAYSLGNFVSGQRKQYTDGGAMVYLSLQKIRYKSDSIVTTIDSAGYYLQWVYRTVDTKQSYYILPVNSFITDTTSFIKDEASRSAFKLFQDDSRQLFARHNKLVSEITTMPIDSTITYKVLLTTIPADSLRARVSMLDELNKWDSFYGVEIEKDESGNILLLSGSFPTAERARRWRTAQVGGAPPKVIRYVNGRKSNWAEQTKTAE